MRRITWPGAALAAVLGTAALSSAAYAAPSTWQCGASAVSASLAGDPAINPVTSNTAPCASNAAGADSLPASLGVPPSVLTAQTLSATTVATPDDDIPAHQGVGAAGRVENLALRLPPGSGTVLLGVRDANARAGAVCVAGTPVVDGSSEVAGVTLDGQQVALDQLAQQLSAKLAPLGAVADLRIDERDRGPGSLTVRALHLRILSATGTPLLEVAAGVASVAYSGAVCDPTGQTGGSGSSNRNGTSGSGKSLLVNGVRGGTCGRLTMYFARNHKTSLRGRYGRRAVVRGRIVNCKGKSIVRARIDVIHVVRGMRHLIKTGLRSREGGKLTLILPSNIKTRDLRFEYRGNLLSTKVTARAKLHITVRNRAHRILR